MRTGRSGFIRSKAGEVVRIQWFGERYVFTTRKLSALLSGLRD
jgi:hypothetical protein